jgi:hypothetical protein
MLMNEESVVAYITFIATSTLFLLLTKRGSTPHGLQCANEAEQSTKFLINYWKKT